VADARCKGGAGSVLVMKILAILLVSLLTFGSKSDYLLLKADSNDRYGYVNSKGVYIIPLGKYAMCYTDTFKNYAIVLKDKTGFVAIDRNERALYVIFPFDNGPDYLSNGLYRIIKNGKIGYADANFSIKIKPQYGCAFPFRNGVAKVSYDCKTISDKSISEYHTWVSDKWFYVNKHGVAIKN
jgi:hypothetical protein